MPRKRQQHAAGFKAKVALLAVQEAKSISELAGQLGVHPSQIHTLKRQLLDGAEGLFESGVEKRQQLVVMATGTAETFTLVNQVHRLMRSSVSQLDRLALIASTQLGTNSSVVSTRAGSANPSTHFLDAFVSYFSPNAAVTASRRRGPRGSLARTGSSSSPT